jgi:hypothetical protein
VSLENLVECGSLGRWQWLGSSVKVNRSSLPALPNRSCGRIEPAPPKLFRSGRILNEIRYASEVRKYLTHHARCYIVSMDCCAATFPREKFLRFARNAVRNFVVTYRSTRPQPKDGVLIFITVTDPVGPGPEPVEGFVPPVRFGSEKPS